MDATAKNQIVERINQASNILVTVSNNPSVDQLASCIGLTLLLNRMDKHATAVFSGKVPSTLEFLQPEKTIETNTDSLRDFIISLDKEKADKLRYKVEDQVVRIFITPYKTSLSEKDLVFSQGDFNVEVVIALGIKDRTQIDAAITAHGRILHDATVISLNAGEGNPPEVGQINWQDPSASSLSEMVVSVSEAFGSGLIDNQMATSFLTGIVAETNRFSNAKTSPKVMTISAQLMAAGANQQLIVSKLEPPVVSVRKYKAPEPAKAKSAGQPEATPDDGTLNIEHDDNKDKPKLSTIDPDEIHIDEKGNLVTAAELAIPAEAEEEEHEESEPPEEPPKASTSPPVSTTPLPPASPKEDKPASPHALLNPEDQAPLLGSTFTATSQPDWADPYNSVSIDPLSGAPTQPALLRHGKSGGDAEPPSPDNARKTVEDAYEKAPFDPGFSPPVQALNAVPVDLDSPKAEKKGDDRAAPPPFPPPLTPSQGVVIPSPPNGPTTP